jgi:uncharacterized protein (TIGR00725 family)
MRRERVIIGVVGATGDCTQPLADLARMLGARLAAEGAILLTGGRGKQTKLAVKDAAVDGALAEDGRVISILKHGVQFEPVVRNGKHVFVHSGLGDARNVLNAFASDAIIALSGGGGTLSEVAFAAVAGRPVYFVGGARGVLAKSIDRMEAIARESAEVFERDFHDATLRDAVRPLLESAHNDCDAEEAVKRALRAERNGVLLPLPRDPHAVAHYERALEYLEQ